MSEVVRTADVFITCTGEPSPSVAIILTLRSDVKRCLQNAFFSQAWELLDIGMDGYPSILPDFVSVWLASCNSRLTTRAAKKHLPSGPEKLRSIERPVQAVFAS